MNTAVILLVSIVDVLGRGGLPACRCRDPQSTRAAYIAATAIAVAKVVEISPEPHRDGINATIVVSRAWKTKLPERLIVRSATTCAFDFVVDREYLLYLSRDPKMLRDANDTAYTTGRCVGNRPLATATTALAWLRTHGIPAGGTHR